MHVENESKKIYIILTKCINWIYVSHLNEMSRMSENLQRQKVAG